MKKLGFFYCDKSDLHSLTIKRTLIVKYCWIGSRMTNAFLKVKKRLNDIDTSIKI